jgi:hypothetical protein
VARLRFEQSIYRIQTCSVTATPTWSVYSLFKFAAVVCCDMNRESHHIPGEELVLPIVVVSVLFRVRKRNVPSVYRSVAQAVCVVG